MNRKSLLPRGLYRICCALPGGTRRAHPRRLSKWRTSGVAALLLLAVLPAQAAVVDLLPEIKRAVVGVGTVNPTGRPQGNLTATGFAVGDGHYVVTCAHAVARPLDSEKKETYAVFVGRDRLIDARPARLVRTDRARDLALLHIDGAPLPVVKLGATAREGQQLYFTGYPIGAILGLNASTHRAGLAAIIPIFTPLQRAAQLTARALRQAQDTYDVYELDAIAYPGDSGSPVWDPDSGEVLAVVNSVFVKGAKETALTAPSGISYAIPVRYVQRLLDTAASDN